MIGMTTMQTTMTATEASSLRVTVCIDDEIRVFDLSVSCAVQGDDVLRAMRAFIGALVKGKGFIGRLREFASLQRTADAKTREPS